MRIRPYWLELLFGAKIDDGAGMELFLSERLGRIAIRPYVKRVRYS